MTDRKTTPVQIVPSGVQGLAGPALTPRIAASFAAAFGTYAGTGRIVLGAAPRPSREMLVSAVSAGLISVGCTPVDAGIVPLPALQQTLRAIGAIGGIAVTGGNAPIEENGLRCFHADGLPLAPHRFSEFLDLYHQGGYPRVTSEALPEAESDGSTADRHETAVFKLINVDRLRQRRFRVALDACNGSASEIGPRFLRALGCEVIPLHGEAGAAVRTPADPQTPDVSQLGGAVVESGADIGFALNADGNRLEIVDGCGTPLSGDFTVALGVRLILQRTPGPVVVSVSTSRMIDDLAETAGVPVVRAPAGETALVERMRACGAPVGGEGDGGLIVPSANPCRDGFVAMALALETLATESVSVRSLRSRLPDYPILKQTVPCRPRDGLLFLRLLKQIFQHETLDVTDGVEVRWPDRRLHVRMSQTESVLRIVSEARTEADARALAELAAEYFRPGAGG